MSSVGTLSLLFAVTSTRHQGAANDGYADNLSFIADAPSANATLLPATLPLFATGLGVVGLLARRRKRKNAAAIVAA